MEPTPHGFYRAWRVGFITANDPMESRGQGVDAPSWLVLLDSRITSSLATLIALKPRSVTAHGSRLVVLTLLLVYELHPMAASRAGATTYAAVMSTRYVDR
jgi:hypothetical protein